MEDSISTVFLDFYGLPGCGKSTVSHMVAQELIRSGQSVAEPSYNLDHNVHSIIRKFKKLGVGIAFAIKYPVLFIGIKRLVRKNGYYKMTESLSQILNVVQKIHFIFCCNGKYDYVLFDEGVTQAAVSLAIKGAVSCNYNKSEIMKGIPDGVRLIPVYMKEEMDIVRIRMRNRNSSDSRAEKEKDEGKRTALLEKIESACEQADISDALVLDKNGKGAKEKSMVVLAKLREGYIIDAAL